MVGLYFNKLGCVGSLIVSLLLSAVVSIVLYFL